MVKKTYLGDEVYANYDDSGRIVLTTKDCSSKPNPTNCIFLEPATVIALMGFIGSLHAREATTKVN